ncbi:MAG: PKD domain-containing protein [Chitinophagales bacterium]
MKKTFTLAIILSLFSSAFSQISLLLSDMPTATQTQRIAIDTFPLPAINFGNKGANQTYDFSNLTLFKYDTIEYRTPTSGQTTICPNADVATTLDGINFILTNNDPGNNKLTLEGFQGLISGNVLGAEYSTKPDLIRFPANYQTNFSGTGYLQKSVPGNQVGQPLVTTIELTINTSAYSDTIDGWGTVKTPLGTYDCLRKKRIETTTTTIRALFLGNWSTVSNSTSTTTRYSYFTKEAKGSVINFNYDTANVLQSVSWSMIPPTAPVANFGANNTSGGLVVFSDSTHGHPDTYSWNFGDGSATSSAASPNHVYTANGAYYVCLTVSNAGGSNTYCDSVHVTGISAANSAPNAANDNETVLQPNPLTVNVGLNDIDPDGDNFCVTLVYGSPAFTIAPTGNCTSVLYTPDSTFTGQDSCYYVICDNGSPVLCDTGILVVTSNANPALLPVADFNWNALYCNGVLINNNSTQSSSATVTIHPLYGIGADSTYNITDTLHYLGDLMMPFQICLTATNQYGTGTKCDTAEFYCEGINENLLTGISIYPNPANNLLSIDMSGNQDEITRSYTAIEIYDALGEKVKTFNRKGDGKLIAISVADLPNGIFVATLIDQTGTRKTLGRFTKK